MNKPIRTFIITSVVILVATGAYFHFFQTTVPKTAVPETPVTVPEPSVTDVPAKEPFPTGETPETAPENTEKNVVPFIVQAPNAQWGNPIFQDGCEEASMLMAMGWVKGTKSVSATEAADTITKLASFEVATLGHHEDMSLWEVSTTLKDYFHYDQAVLLEDVASADIRQELDDGNIVLAPTFGQALRNPNYTAPGPITHMLVLTGYDSKTKEFIVNDPGTRRGENYRYSEKVLFDAIWAYPAGTTHPPIPSPADRRKSVIVIQPAS